VHYGGLPGSCNHIVIIRDGEVIWDGGRVFNFKLKKGDIVSIRSGGSGGWGNPLERDPVRVAEDYKNGLISLDVAKNIYGVVINPQTNEIDFEATRKLREKMSSKGT